MLNDVLDEDALLVDDDEIPLVNIQPDVFPVVLAYLSVDGNLPPPSTQMSFGPSSMRSPLASNVS